MQARQGDIFFESVELVPDEAAVVQDGIIARGETTGHMHRLMGAVLLVHAGRMYIQAPQDAEVLHEEHKPVTLPQGCYVVTRQREYIPQGWQQVQD